MTSPTTDVQQVRLLISDPAQTDTTRQTFSDADVQAFLDLNEGYVRLAAADALEQMAGKLVDFTSDDATTTGSKQAATLMARAASLRTAHYTNGEAAGLTIVLGPAFRGGPVFR